MLKRLRHQKRGVSPLRIYWIGLILSGCATLSSCKKEGPYIDELCQLNGDGTAECSDGEAGSTKSAEDLVNYIALSPENYSRLLDWGRGSVQVHDIKLSDKIDWGFLEGLGNKL